MLTLTFILTVISILVEDHKEYFNVFYTSIFAKIKNTLVCYTAKADDCLYTYGSKGVEYIVNTHNKYIEDDEDYEDFIVIDEKRGINPANWLGLYTGNYKCNAHYNDLRVWANFF